MIHDNSSSKNVIFTFTLRLIYNIHKMLAEKTNFHYLHYIYLIVYSK